MNNNIFNDEEIEKWTNNIKLSKYFKSSINVSELINNYKSCYSFIEENGFYPDILGMKYYIRYWKNIIIPLAKEFNLPIA